MNRREYFSCDWEIIISNSTIITITCALQNWWKYLCFQIGLENSRPTTSRQNLVNPTTDFMICDRMTKTTLPLDKALRRIRRTCADDNDEFNRISNTVSSQYLQQDYDACASLLPEMRYQGHTSTWSRNQPRATEARSMAKNSRHNAGK